MEKVEIKNLDADSLKKEINSLRKEFFNLKMNSIAGQVKDFSQFKKLRKDIARCLTFLDQKSKKI